MKKRVFALLIILALISLNDAYAEKARDIQSSLGSAYHTDHLAQHLNANDLHGTGNYLKVREKAKDSKVLGHLEQADRFTLLALKNGYAQVEITESAETSPDSWVGLTGWVNADYIDCACSQAQYYTPVAALSMPQGALIPSDAVGQYIFCSGAGGWATYLTLLADGSFFGSFSDEDMGDNGPTYPNGTQYFCDFSGRFTNLIRLNDFSYAITLDTLTVVPAKDHIQDGVRYAASGPYGLENSTAFVLYTPDTPMNSLSEEFISWICGPLSAMPKDRLGCYAIYNEGNQSAFMAYPY